MTTAALQPDPSLLQTRSKRLREATHSAHESLDKGIMAGNPFADKQRYALFLLVQYQFHRDIDALYDNETLDELLPDLKGRRRFTLVGQDLTDLGVALPEPDNVPAFGLGQAADIPQSLGWLYVAEGSNLGAAFLLKEAEKLGLSDHFGARHLAGAPEGRGLHWKTFTRALDTIELSDAEEARVVDGARQAFLRVRELVRGIFG